MADAQRTWTERTRRTVARLRPGWCKNVADGFLMATLGPRLPLHFSGRDRGGQPSARRFSCQSGHSFKTASRFPSKAIGSDRPGNLRLLRPAVSSARRLACRGSGKRCSLEPARSSSCTPPPPVAPDALRRDQWDDLTRDWVSLRYRRHRARQAPWLLTRLNIRNNGAKNCEQTGYTSRDDREQIAGGDWSDSRVCNYLRRETSCSVSLVLLGTHIAKDGVVP